jgi:hypothetical protein
MGKSSEKIHKKRKDRLFSDDEDDTQPPQLIPIKQETKATQKISAVLSKPVK